jgi:hypothetical protein
MRKTLPIPVPIKCADGKIRHLRFTLGSIARLENMYFDGTDNSPSFFAIMAKVDSKDLTSLRDIVWAGLLHEKEGLTPEDVGKLLCLTDVDYFIKQIHKAEEQDVGPLNELISRGFVIERTPSHDSNE